ncbi:hypothetical protein DSL72_004137 [Monilinia vaccinii-corymbosi]|uniref:Uncharacterized protein n=1 Tax=Monilinia vaccinii-corymbosi TaxID=61207 RepID=A0A8A3P3Z2_9HELO|nr:hypothetical protein DSL72_004137 [Monilinia vaccinii-corymbosi]
MAGARTRAQGLSPGGFKTLDDIEKPKRGRGRGRGKKGAKAEAESQSVVEAEAESQAAESQAAESQAAESQAAESQAAESQAAESQAAESQAAESQAAESQAAESQAAESQPIESQSVVEPEVESQLIESQLIESQSVVEPEVESQPIESQPVVEPEVESQAAESQSIESQPIEAERDHNTESQNATPPPTNPSRANSPGSHSPSPSPSPTPTPVDRRPMRRRPMSRSPPPRNIFQSNDAARISPLGSNRKRSREDSSSDGDAEDEVEQPSSKRVRISPPQKRSREESPTHNSDEAAKQPSGKRVRFSVDEAKEPRGRPARNRVKATPRPAIMAFLDRRQDHVVLNESSSDESSETTTSPLPSQSKAASKAAPKSALKAAPKPAPRPPITSPRRLVHERYQQKQSYDAYESDYDWFEDDKEAKAGPSSNLVPPEPIPSVNEIFKMTDPETRFRVAVKHYGKDICTSKWTALFTDLLPHMTRRERILAVTREHVHPGRYVFEGIEKEVAKEKEVGKGKEVAKEVTQEASQSTNDVPQTDYSQSESKKTEGKKTGGKKTTAVASSRENRSKSNVPSSRRKNRSKSDVPSPSRPSPSDALNFADPYLVSVANAFHAHKNKSKTMPSVEQVTAFLDTFDVQQPSSDVQQPSSDVQQPSSDVNVQMDVEKPLLQEKPRQRRRNAFVVPGWGTDDTVSSDESDDEPTDDDEPKAPEAPKAPEEPKAPEAPISPVQEASPHSSWWNPISTVATIITSPFRKLVPPPFIFNQPPTTPSAAPLKRMSQSDRKGNVRNKIRGRPGAGFQTERHPPHKDVESEPVKIPGLFTVAEIKELHRMQDEYAARNPNPALTAVTNHDIHKTSREARRKSFTNSAEKEPQSSTPARSGDKRDANGAPKPRTTQRWNDFMAHYYEGSSSSEDEDEVVEVPQYYKWIFEMRSGLYLRSDAIDRMLYKNEFISADNPFYQHLYRHYRDFPKPDIFKPAGVQNPLNSSELLQQARLREAGDKRIPDESENDYRYVLNQTQRDCIFYSAGPYCGFDIPGQRLSKDHLANMKEGLPLLTPRDESGAVIKKPRHDTGPLNIFAQLRNRDETQSDTEQADVGADRTLEPKQWTQTPPPKPKPVNATLPGTPEKAPISEAVQQAMNKANKYLPAKSSGLRNVAVMSPLQVEADKDLEARRAREREEGERITMEAAERVFRPGGRRNELALYGFLPTKGKEVSREPDHPISSVDLAKSKEVSREPDHPIFNFDFTNEDIGFAFDPSVKKAVSDCLAQGLIPITPIPEDIWNEHADLPVSEVESAVATLFSGIDARMYGSAHNGMVPGKN